MNKIILTFFLLAIALYVQAGTLSAEKLYQQNCMVCHADDGRGAMPGVSDLSESKRLFSVNESQLVERIKKGVQVKGSPISMPPKGGNPNLTDDDLFKILKYLKEIVKE